MTSSPPSFDSFFNQQKHQNSTSSSSGGYPSNPFPEGAPNFATNQLLTEEPPTLQRRGSNASLHSQHSHRRSASGASLGGSATGLGQSGEQRQDSIPFQSTLINTAEKGQYVGAPAPSSSGLSHMQQHAQGPPDPNSYMFSNSASQGQYSGLDNRQTTWRKDDSYQQFGLSNMPTQPNVYSNTMSHSSPYGAQGTPGSGSYLGDTPLSMGFDPSSIGQAGSDTFVYNQGSPYNMAGLPQGAGGGDGSGMWTNEAFDQGADQGGMNDAGLEELENFIRSLSREPSPPPQSDNFFVPQQLPQTQNLQTGQLQTFTPEPAFQHDSGSGSRSSSPFPVVAPSPSYSANFPRPGSSSGTSPFMKPQSPPALIMPNNAPSPQALPPIVTQPNNPPQPGAQGHSLANQMGGMGGLLPPTNPALEHLSGMMGISPIAPSADGPQIFVQPSTPISGLKDGRGHFDAALRRAAAQAQLKQGGSSQASAATQQQHYQQTQSQQGSAHNSPQPNYATPLPANQSPWQQPPQQSQSQNASHPLDFAASMRMQNTSTWGDLGGNLGAFQQRPRSKSDSGVSGVAQDFDRMALANFMAQAQAMGLGQGTSNGGGGMMNGNQGSAIAENDPAAIDWRNNVGAWLTSMGINAGQGQVPQQQQFQHDIKPFQQPSTVNPNQLPGNDQANFLTQLAQQHQLSQLQAQKAKQNPLSVNTSTSAGSSGVLKYEPGEFSPTSLAFYQARGMFTGGANTFTGGEGGLGGVAASASHFNTTFPNLPQSGTFGQVWPSTAGPSQTSFLNPTNTNFGGAAGGFSDRRRSFTEGLNHPASGAGTPGYGVGLQGNTGQSVFGTLDPGKMRGVGAAGAGVGAGHRRAAKSEDFGRGGWGLGQGGSTTDFLHSITANDGSLIPPLRGRSGSHSRHSSGSSVRSASPALSVSSQGSGYSRNSSSGHGHGHMEMPEGTQIVPPRAGGGGGKAKVAKMKVTSMATEVAATSRRTNSGIFKCPVPGCGSTFTRHFNLKGHMRSHNDERPYKCDYDGCPKAEIGFARQHDCKRHMLLHEGLRPFVCEGCNKKFARLDALTRHHKSEQGQECAISHPLPVNPDGSAMSESQYKTYKAAQEGQGGLQPGSAAFGAGSGRRASFGSSVGGASGDEEDIGTGSGMEDYDLM